MSEKKKVKVKGVVETSLAIEYLKELVSHAEKGKVAIICDGRGMEMSLPKYLKLEVEAEEKKGKHELSFELSWSEDLKDTEELDLRIASSNDPEIQECLRSELDSQQQPPCAEF